MSQYIPWTAVARELEMQATRKRIGLKTGFYTAYPSADKDHFVVKTRLLTEEFKAMLDKRLELIVAAKLAREEGKKSGTNS